MKELTTQEIHTCMALMSVCSANNVTIQSENRWVMMGELKLLKITGEETCILGGPKNVIVVAVVTRDGKVRYGKDV